jgi:hypothetical protein
VCSLHSHWAQTKSTVKELAAKPAVSGSKFKDILGIDCPPICFLRSVHPIHLLLSSLLFPILRRRLWDCTHHHHFLESHDHGYNPVFLIRLLPSLPMSHHSDTHSSRSARSRRRRHHHARSHTSSSYITREPQPISQPEPEHIPIGHVWDLIFRKYKSPNTKELTAGQREQKKPFSAVTVAVENLTSESYEEDDLSGIPDLVEAIKLQATGPAEAARAIRKKLKYGNNHRQIRALTILDGLIQNAGARFQRTFADEMLLERLRICGTSDLTDPLVRDKCKELFRSWAAEYKNVRGLEQIASLYKVRLTFSFG